MSQELRINNNKFIDQTIRLSFKFNGEKLYGYKGDTLASALLANNIHLVGRSFKYHRPRGIMTCGSEEPNAIVQIGNDPSLTDPNVRATEIELYEGLEAFSQNCWPNVKFDIGGINNLLSPLLPAGFYYKTFMWPASFGKNTNFLSGILQDWVNHQPNLIQIYTITSIITVMYWLLVEVFQA